MSGDNKLPSEMLGERNHRGNSRKGFERTAGGGGSGVGELCHHVKDSQ